MVTMDFFIHCSIYAGLYTLALLITALKSPRLLLDYYPEEIKYQVKPKTIYEAAMAKKYQTMFAIVCVMYPFVVTCFNSLKYDWPFWQTTLFSCRLMTFVNIYDLLIIDWLIFCTITPKFIVISGTLGNEGYKNYNIHFFNFLRAFIIISGISIFSAFIIHLKL